MDSSRPGNNGGPAIAPVMAGLGPALALGAVTLDSLPESIAVLDRAGVITFVNRAWRRLAVQNDAGPVGCTGVGTNYLEATQRGWGAVTAQVPQLGQGIQQVMSGQLPEFTLEYPCHSPGHERWFLLQVNPLEELAGGAVVVTHADITARKQAELALADNRLRLEQAIQVAAAGLWDWDLATDRVNYSLEWKIQTGHDQIPISDRLTEWEDRLHPEDQERVMAELRAGMAGTQALLNLEFQFCHRDGAYHWIQCRLRFIRDAAGRAIRVLGCHLDITERKLLEAQFRHAQKQASLGRLAGTVAHDFNNLLTVILGYNELLLDAPELDPSLRDSLLEMRSAGEKAASLAAQLLVFSRNHRLEPTILDINEMVASSEKMLRRLLGETVKLVTRLAPDPGQVRVASGQMEHVLMNLAVNARDAMPAGGRLTIETNGLNLEEAAEFATAGMKPGRLVVLSVTDNGEGMDATTQARIFEPFFTTKEPGKGTGLGLAMVSGFIQQSGGHIAVTSAPGAGTTFKIYLPREEFPEYSEESMAEPQELAAV